MTEINNSFCYGVNVTPDEIRMDIGHGWNKLHTSKEMIDSLGPYRLERILYRKPGEIWELLRHSADKDSAIIRFSVREGTDISGSIAFMNHESAKAVFYQLEEEENQ